ncbi:MAG: hypothetical protein ABW321_29480 [Polyangiales bacterium]
MLKTLIRSRIQASQKDLGYDMSYGLEILDADLGAFMRISKLVGISSYRGPVPDKVAFAVKLVGTLQEDCGPCSQLMVTQAERAGVAPEVLRAVVSADDAVLDPEVLLGVLFARASLAREPVADTLREQVKARWGRRGVIQLAFGLVAARAFPTLKYALGFGQTCSRIRIGDKSLAPQHMPAARSSATV